MGDQKLGRGKQHEVLSCSIDGPQPQDTVGRTTLVEQCGAAGAWCDPVSATTVLRLIEAAGFWELLAIAPAMMTASEAVSDPVPVDIPGFGGYLARGDVRPLQRRVWARIVEHDPQLGAQAAVAARDADIRLTMYLRRAQQMSKAFAADVKRNPGSHIEARIDASGTRNRIRTEGRGQLSAGARGMSEAVEANGPTVLELANKYALKWLKERPALCERFGIVNLAFGDPKTELALAKIRDSPAVSDMIIKSAGKPNTVMNGAARVTRIAGSLLMVGQAAGSIYRVLDAEEGEHLWTTGRELAGFSGGTLGGAAGGVIIGTLGACVAGAGIAVAAPVAIVVSLVIIGGAVTAGAEAGTSVWDTRVDRQSLQEFEREMAA
ncbi:MAG: hypothetical protein WKG01_23105, partial [Kofleriaceae bacterium]